MIYYTERLKELREIEQKTQTEVAKDLGLKREQYRRYETGLNEIKATFIIKICKYYNISSDYLLGLSNEMKELENTTNKNITININQ